MLSEYAWVPSHGGPGDARFRIPRQVWVDVPRGAARTVLPSPTAAPADPKAVGIPSVQRPPLDRLEDALVAVQASYPDLGEAPAAVRDGLDWLLRKVDQSAAHAKAANATDLTWPARRDGIPVWSASPLIADVPGIDQIPNAAWLPDAPWPGLQGHYGIRRASAAVSTTVTDQAVRSAPLLNPAQRVELLALLMDERGGDVRSLAFRLANLDERHVSALVVAYDLDGRRWQETPMFHLAERRDARGTLRGGRLTARTGLASSQKLALAQVIAQYLGLPAAGNTIGLYLTVGSDALAANHILDSQLVEAAEALHRHPERSTGPESDELSSDSTSSAPETSATPGADDFPAARQADDFPPHPGPVAPGISLGSSPGSQAARGATAVRAPQGPLAPGELSPRLGERGGSHHLEPANSIMEVTFGQSVALPGAAPPRVPSSGGGRTPRTGERPGAGTSGPVSEEAAVDRRTTELAAEKVTTLFLEHHYEATVEKVSTQNLGWDLTATLPNGSVLHVEVKAFSGTSPDFIITRGELSTVRADPVYRLCIVTGLGGRSGKLAWIEDVSVLLEDDFVEPLEWVVRAWGRAPHLQLPWSKGE